MALVPKMAPPWGHMFNIGIYMEQLNSLSETARPRAYIWHVASTSRRPLRLFKLWHWGQK